MKKLVNLKEIMIIILSVALITVATTAFASDIVLGTGSQDATQIDANEYQTVQNAENNTSTANNELINNATTNNSINNAVNNNNAKTYNTNNSKSNLPQTGIEDYNVGILLVIGIASAIFAFKKVQDYKNI